MIGNYDEQEIWAPSIIHKQPNLIYGESYTMIKEDIAYSCTPIYEDTNGQKTFLFTHSIPIISKDMFLECYNKWIKGGNNKC